MRLPTLSLLLAAILYPGAAQAIDPPSIPHCGGGEGRTAPVALTPHVATHEDYPPLSNILGESGDTEARYVIQADGSVGEVRVIRSSGSLRLDDATVVFVKRFKFKPQTANGGPVACTNEIMMRWSLDSFDPADPQIGELMASAIRPSKDQFPVGAIARGENGAAVAALWVAATGQVDGVVLVRPTRYPDLNDASLELLRKQKVVTATVGGKAVRTLILIAVVWGEPDRPPFRPLSNAAPLPPTPADKRDPNDTGQSPPK